MTVFISLLFFALGTVVGSFLNTVAYRSVYGGSVFSGRSFCPRCKHDLSTRDLIPLVSYFTLRGRCRYCSKKISVQYPIVEAATGIVFAFVFLYWFQSIESFTYHASRITFLDYFGLVYLLFLVSILIVLAVTDIVDGLLPNSVVLPSIVIVASYKLFLLFAGNHTLSSLSLDFLSAFLAAAAFFAIVYLSKEKALGGGDVKLIFLLSLIVGWPILLLNLFLAFLTGGIVAVMLILLGKKRFGQSLPLGPFLNLGTFISIFYGQQLLDIYLRAL